MSFVNKEGIYALIEELLLHSWPENLPKLQVSFPRMTYAKAMQEVSNNNNNNIYLNHLQIHITKCKATFIKTVKEKKKRIGIQYTIL